MTAAEYRAGVERLTASRGVLLEFEALAMELARQPEAGQGKGLLLVFKEQLHATRLLALEVGAVDAARRAAVQKPVGWGHE
jgi:hypothetical protein